MSRYDYKVYSFIDQKNRVRWAYDIRDTEDVIMWHGEYLPELVEESPVTWAHEESAERNAETRVKELNNKG